MPLSEDEERILSEIAQQFYADDPEFAREVGETTLFTHTVRRMKWSIFGLVAAAVLLVATLATSFWDTRAGGRGRVPGIRRIAHHRAWRGIPAR